MATGCGQWLRYTLPTAYAIFSVFALMASIEMSVVWASVVSVHEVN